MFTNEVVLDEPTTIPFVSDLGGRGEIVLTKGSMVPSGTVSILPV